MNAENTAQKLQTNFQANQDHQLNQDGFQKDDAILDEKFSRAGHWSQNQNAKYYAFLMKFKDKFIVRQSRRQWKVFKALSEFIETRNASQCRSHHHKMTKNFKSIQQTLMSMRNKNLLLEEKSKVYLQKLRKIDLTSIQQCQFYQAFRKSNELLQNKRVPKNTPKTCQGLPEPKASTKHQDIACLLTEVTYNSLDKFQKNNQTSLYDFPVFYLSEHPTTGLMNFSSSFYKQFKSQWCPGNGFNFGQPKEEIRQSVDGKKNDQQNNFIYEMKRKRMQKQKKLIQCHQYFIRWLNKANQLTF